MTVILLLSSSTGIELQRATNFLRRRSRYSFVDTGTSTISFSFLESVSTMHISIILRDPDAARKLFETILDAPNGRRSLSRLARTSKAMEPALDVLWRDLDSLIPVLGLFPAHLMRRTKKPGMGLICAPEAKDWKQITHYAARIQRLTYDESLNNVNPTVFTLLEQHKPGPYILPQLTHLTWKAETNTGLDRCVQFLHPNLQSFAITAGARFSGLEALLMNITSQARLTSFQFISPTPLPYTFTELMQNQTSLQKLVLVAPGALSPRIGRWIAGLNLVALQLDLSQRSLIAVEGFFDDLRPRSGDSTPSSVGSTDSGVFSGEELDFSDIRKSALRLTGDMPAKGSFKQLQKLQLTGEASNIAVFLKHLTSPLNQLDLVIEDPPDQLSWQDLTSAISEMFTNSLQTLRVSATGSSRFAELIRATSRADKGNRLSLVHFTSLPQLTYLEIELPESIVFLKEDISSLAAACPNLEILRLCPMARFLGISGAPTLTLEDICPLLKGCKRLHMLSIVVNAKGGSNEVLESQEITSTSLSWLHIGYSWVTEPLHVAILLSHLAPRLESLRWFAEKNRLGYVEAHARDWAIVSEALPHLQRLRLWEQSSTRAERPTENVRIDGEAQTEKVMMAEQGSQVIPLTADAEIQAVPEYKVQTLQTEDINIGDGSELSPILPYIFDLIAFMARLLYFAIQFVFVALDKLRQRKHALLDTSPPKQPQLAGNLSIIEVDGETKDVRE